MNAQTCQNCIHWKQDNAPWQRPSGLCSCPKLTDASNEPETDGLYAWQWNMAESNQIATGPLFGCIHFAQKQSN